MRKLKLLLILLIVPVISYGQFGLSWKNARFKITSASFTGNVTIGGTLGVTGISTFNNRVNVNVSESTIGLSIDGNKTTGNLFQAINDNDGAVGDSSVVISSKGYMGIGYTTPTTKLNVAGSIMNIGAAAVTSFAGTVSSSSTTVTFSSAADAILAGYSATNPVIGTTIIAGGQTRYIASWTDATNAVVGTAPSPAWSTTAITSTQFPTFVSKKSDGTIGMVQNAAGNVGIGIIGAGHKFLALGNGGRFQVGNSVDGAPASIFPTGNSAITIFRQNNLEDTAFNFYVDASNQTNFNTGNAAYIFRTNSTERVRITSTGNVGIGTAAPGAKLEINGDKSADTLLIVRNDKIGRDSSMVVLPDGSMISNGASSQFKVYNYYADTSSVSDAYGVVTTNISAYVAGMALYVNIQVANTDAATLEINSLGAKAIKKRHDQDVATGDIEVGQIILVIYDGTNFQMLSQLAQ